MIVKLQNTGRNESAFFDEFEYICKAFVDKKLIQTDKYNCSTSCYVGETAEKVLRLRLFNRSNEIVRVIYVDACYHVYLLSNEGNTIERLY